MTSLASSYKHLVFFNVNLNCFTSVVHGPLVIENSSFSHEEELSMHNEVSGQESVITDRLRMFELLFGDGIVEMLKGEVDLSMLKNKI